MESGKWRIPVLPLLLEACRRRRRQQSMTPPREPWAAMLLNAQPSGTTIAASKRDRLDLDRISYRDEMIAGWRTLYRGRGGLTQTGAGPPSGGEVLPAQMKWRIRMHAMKRHERQRGRKKCLEKPKLNGALPRAGMRTVYSETRLRGRGRRRARAGAEGAWGTTAHASGSGNSLEGRGSNRGKKKAGGCHGEGLLKGQAKLSARMGAGEGME